MSTYTTPKNKKGKPMNNTFNNLKSMDIEQALCDSQGEPIKETKQIQTILFNTDRISEDEILTAIDSKTLDRLIYDHKILILESYQSMIISDT